MGFDIEAAVPQRGVAMREDDFGGLGFNIDEMRSTVRRQFVGSIVVGCLIVAVSGITAMRPAHLQEAHDDSKQHNLGVRQPIFAPAQNIASRNYAAELPSALP
jgi:hypothetical protein